MNKNSNPVNERISPPECGDEEALREYGRQLAIDSLMEQLLLDGEAKDSPANIVPLRTRRWGPRVWIPAAAAALVTIAGISIWKLGEPPAALATLDPKWVLQAASDADYRIIDPNRVELRKGELRFTSLQPASLIVDTPNARSTAKGTDFLIGHHLAENQTTSQEKPNSKNDQTMNKSKNITRMLVLAGTVTLANAKGNLAAGPNEAVVAQAGDAPQKILVEANSSFAFDLYAQLAKEKPGKNLFFSPYSMSNALLMAAEGARGQTAREMGMVLGFPEALLRQGDEGQLIPWEMGKIRVGQSELNRLMNIGDAVTPEQAQMQAEEASLMAQIDEMQKKMETLDKDARSDLAWEKHRVENILERLRDRMVTSKLRVANAIWGEQTLSFNKDWQNTVADAYGVDAVQQADFLANADKERLRINEWGEKKTEGLIKDLFAPGSLDSETRLVLVNATYFKAEWKAPFNEDRTNPGVFTLGSGDTINVPLMRQFKDYSVRYAAFHGDGSFFETPTKLKKSQINDATVQYPGKDGFAVIEKSYRGDKLSMVIIAPNDPAGLPAIEARLTAERLNTWINSLKKRDTHVFMPKFRLETSYDGLEGTLAAMGMPSAFDESSADFSGMTSEENMFLGSVIQKAFINVNEAGTEAAALTGMSIARSGIDDMGDFIPTFRADRPFLYLIRDIESGTVLFIGRMLTPPAE